MRKWKMGMRKIGMAFFLAALSGAAILFWPELQTASQVLLEQDPEGLILYLQTVPYWAGLVSFGLMLLQAVVAPLPAFVITMANGALFGVFYGALLSLVSACLAALLCFQIARTLGQEWLEQKLGEQTIFRMNSWIRKYGLASLLIARFLPWMPFDPFSFFFGLSGMTAKRFFLWNLAVQLPATLFYTLIGAGLLEEKMDLSWVGLGLLGLMGLGLLAQQKVRRTDECSAKLK